MILSSNIGSNGVFGIITAILAAGYARLSKKVKANRDKQTAIEQGMQALLRDRIIQAYNHYTDKGCFPIYAQQNVEALYNAYHALGGNGTVTRIYNEMMKLPTEGGKKDED